MAWVKFHEELRAGAKRGIPRATRFIYMELCLLARPGRGVVALPIGMNALNGVHDILGGSRGEVVRALETLTAGEAPMVRVEGEPGALRVVIPAWSEWNTTDLSTPRTKQHRSKLNSETEQFQQLTQPGNAFPGCSERDGNATGTRRERSQIRSEEIPPTPHQAGGHTGPLRGSGELASDLPDDFAEAADADQAAQDPGELPPLVGRPRSQRRDVAAEVHEAYLVGWERWVGKGTPPRLDDRRRKLINTRAKDFTVEQLVAAVRGAWADTWHRADPARRMSLDQIFANTERVEKHMASDAKSAPRSSSAARPGQPAPLDGRVIERPLPQEEPVQRRDIPVPPLAALLAQGLARKSLMVAPTMPKLAPTGET